MRKDYRLLFGPVAGVILTFGIPGLALMIPGYSHVHQTVSEIGESGSPARVPFAVVLCCVAACILFFATAVRDRSVQAGHSPSAAYLTGFMALSAAGVGLFAYPNPLHNVFGISELIGYQAPLCLALTWRRDPRAELLVSVSWILYVIICAAIVLNLSSLNKQESGLGLRETRLWSGPKSTLRRLVRLVRPRWHDIPATEMAKAFRLRAVLLKPKWQASAAVQWRWSTPGLNATTATATLSLLSAERSESVH